MIKRSKHFTLASIVSLLVFNTAFLSANEVTIEEAFPEEHVTVRSRELDSRMQERIRSDRAKEQEEEKSAPKTSLFKHASLSINPKGEFQLASARQMAPEFTLTSAAFGFPVSSHALIDIADNGRSVEIEDGSHWEVSASDGYVLNGWRRSDQLVITPNYSWFGNYDYYIVNKSDRGSAVQANLWVGPLQYGAYSHWIADIDAIGGHVRLENDMVWCIDPKDAPVFKSWAINDHIILGTHESWFSPYTHILINVNMDEHVKARQY